MTLNINDAIAAANRNARALNLIEAGYSFTMEASGSIAVCKPGELHAAYFIGAQVDGTDGCSCPDKAKTGKACKHEIAWKMIQDEEADEARMWDAKCAQWDAEEGYAYNF